MLITVTDGAFVSIYIFTRALRPPLPLSLAAASPPTARSPNNNAVCPECDSDQLDIQALTFAKIAEPSAGRVKIQYRQVRARALVEDSDAENRGRAVFLSALFCLRPESVCFACVLNRQLSEPPPLAFSLPHLSLFLHPLHHPTPHQVECAVPSDVQIAVMDFRGDGGFLRLSVQDAGAAGAVAKVEVRGAGSDAWQALTNTWGAAWETGTAPSAPLSFRVSLSDGAVLDMPSVVDKSGIAGGAGAAVKFGTGQQFGGSEGEVKAFDSGSGDPMLLVGGRKLLRH